MPDTVLLPERITKAMENVAPGVTGLQVVMANVYAIFNRSGSWVLVDAGLPFSAGRIRRWAELNFGANQPPKCILLTHGHFDHIGAVEQLGRDWDVPVYAHPMEFPYLNGTSKYPPPDPMVGGGAMPLFSPLYPRGPIDISDRLRPLAEDGDIPELPGWRWIHTPGHTAGHVSLFRDDDRVLIAGDAFVTTNQDSLVSVVTQRPEIHGPPAYFTSDWEAAKLSVQRLAGLYPQVMATGHGVPLAGTEATAALEALADNFDELGRPKRGRYVSSPAVTDERGVISVPPVPRQNRIARIAVGAAVGGMVWMMMRPRIRNRWN